MDLQDQLKTFSDHEPLRRKKLKKYHMNYMFKRTYDFKFEKKKEKLPRLLKVMKEATKILKS
jgi:hypothetical protein